MAASKLHAMHLNTDSLDEAMKELLDICKQYNEELSMKATNNSKEIKASGPVGVTPTAPLAATKTTMANNCDQSGSIERLQQRQGNLQAQLDEALKVAKSLASKQKRKLKSILEDNTDSCQSNIKTGTDQVGEEVEEEEEDELIEFQQIENELRISELNRQLDNVQEELRIRLYKRLLSNTKNDSKPIQKDTAPGHDSTVRASSHPYESSPSSSSCCSDEPTTSAESTTNIYSNINLNNTNNNNNGNSMTSTYSHTTHHHTASPTCLSTNRNNSANSDLERIEEDEEDCQDYYSDSDRFRTIYEEKLSPIIYEHHQQQQSANNRFHTTNAAATGQDVTTTHFQPPERSSLVTLRHHQHQQQQQLGDSGGFMNSQQIIQIQQGLCGDNNNPNNDYSFSNQSSSDGGSSNRVLPDKTANSRTSRPLTLYLPRPDDEIDLVDHIQALGHDLSLISSDLKMDSTSAQGYLWKCCSNNNRKWLKRYFYLDRSSQTLSYYESEAQLVKKNGSPRNCIHFNEISDVYVDHKLSGIGERDRSSKRKNYVFVLATNRRKYLLASSRAETMRAWIDTLFTAAKANDYFQEISNIEDQYDESFCCTQVEK